MKRLENIAGEIDEIDVRSGDREVGVEAICHDSRSVDEGTLFVALRGDRADGHDYVDQAIERGASAVVVDRQFDRSVDVPVLEAQDTRAVLGPLAAYFYDYPSRELDVVGITGTNGKTTISHLLEAMFSASGRSAGVIGTIEVRWNGASRTTPNTTPSGLVLQRTLREMADDGVDVAIVEVSSHGLALGRVDGTRFTIGLFTNLSRDHIEFHGSLEEYRRAKWRLFDRLLPASKVDEATPPVAVVNTDNDEGRRLVDHLLVDATDIVVAAHGTGEPRDNSSDRWFGAREIETSVDGISASVRESKGCEYRITAPLPGRFNIENALGAVAVARLAGVSKRDVTTGLATTRGVPGRMERVDGETDGPAVIVDYAHTPAALQRVLETLRPLTEDNLWIVFGCGGDRDRSKRAPMGRIAARCADRVVVTSDNPRTEDPGRIIDDIVEGLGDDSGGDWRREPDRRQAIVDTVVRAGPKDVILVAGKGHETYQEQNGRRIDFDDRKVVRQAFRRRGD